MTHLLPADTPVRLTGTLGGVAHLDATRFTCTVEAGTEGRYLFPHPNPRLAGWHIVAVTVDGEDVLVPCGPEHFEEVTPR